MRPKQIVIELTWVFIAYLLALVLVFVFLPAISTSTYYISDIYIDTQPNTEEGGHSSYSREGYVLAGLILFPVLSIIYSIRCLMHKFSRKTTIILLSIVTTISILLCATCAFVLQSVGQTAAGISAGSSKVFYLLIAFISVQIFVLALTIKNIVKRNRGQ